MSFEEFEISNQKSPAGLFLVTTESFIEEWENNLNHLTF